MAREITRFTINLNKELADKVDAYAEKMNINRTAAVAVLLSQAVNANETLDTLSKMLEALEDAKSNSGERGTSLS